MAKKRSSEVRSVFRVVQKERSGGLEMFVWIATAGEMLFGQFCRDEEGVSARKVAPDQAVSLVLREKRERLERSPHLNVALPASFGIVFGDPFTTRWEETILIKLQHTIHIDLHIVGVVDHIDGVDLKVSPSGRSE